MWLGFRILRLLTRFAGESRYPRLQWVPASAGKAMWRWRRIAFDRVEPGPAPPPARNKTDALRLQQQLADDLAALEHFVRAGSLSQWQTVVDQRPDRAGGKMSEQRLHRCGANIRA